MRDIPALKRASWASRSVAVTAVALTIFAAIQAFAIPAAVAKSRAQVVQVKMRDFSFTFLPRSVKHGTVTFALANAGEATHNLKINGRTSKLLNPGEHGSLTVTFRRAGKYPYLCTIPGHADLGMKGVLTVT